MALAPVIAATLVAAPFAGSFMALTVERWGTDEGIVAGRSRCNACRRRLGPRDLVPVLSWLVLRGRCRHCGAPIGMFCPAMELAALGTAIWSMFIFPEHLFLPSVLLGWILLTAGEIDRRQMILPDALTLPLIPLGLLTIWLAAPAALADAAIGATAGAASLWGVRAVYSRLRGREGLGLGDVKLFAAAGAWVGWMGLPSVLVWAGVLGLAAALTAGLAKGGLRGSDALPFGPFLAAGLWLVWSFGPFAAGA